MPVGSERRVVVGLGGNLGDPERTVNEALDAVVALAGVRELARSRLYRTTPVGGPPQPDFVNAAVALSTARSARDLLAALQAIERRFGRTRGPERNAPRTLDLDLLFVEGETLDEPDLVLPHPRLAERPFALVPLLDVTPDARDPSGVPYADHLSRVGTDGVAPLSGPSHRP